MYTLMIMMITIWIIVMNMMVIMMVALSYAIAKTEHCPI